LAVLIAENLPIDRHYVNNPANLFNNPTSDLPVDLDNKVILEAHLQCAGQEMPLSLEDEKILWPLFKEILRDEAGQKTQKAGKDVFYGTAFVLHTITRYLTHPSIYAISG